MRRLLLTLSLLLLAPWAWGAAVSVGTTYNSSTNCADATGCTTVSFTPTNGDLLVVFAAATGATAAATTPECTSSIGITFYEFAESEPYASTTRFLCVAESLSDGSATTVTAKWNTGGAVTGAFIFVSLVSGMTNTGSAAVVQTATGSGAPATATFSASASTGNPTFAYQNDPDSNPPTVTEPTGWTERADVGYNTPVEGAEYATRDSGFTGTTITWGSSSGTGYALILELVPGGGGGGPTCAHTLPLLGAGCS